MKANIVVTTPDRSNLMKRVRQEGTDSELALRRLLTEVGADYRLNVRDLPGKPDIANKSQKKAIFLNGCFWHFHSTCPRGRLPKRNRSFWGPKFRANRLRDQRKVSALKDAGFDVLVVWECELQMPDLLKDKLQRFWYPDDVVGRRVDRQLLLDDGPESGDRIETFTLDLEGGELVRAVVRRDGGSSISSVAITEPVTSDDLSAAFDQAWLRLPDRPDAGKVRGEVRVVDLFCGCGGMSVGVQEACRALGLKMRPVLAVDTDFAAREVYQDNFPSVWIPEDASVEELLPGEPGEAKLHPAENDLRERLGEIDLVVAGPPCQGHSDLNNHTRRTDPKNALFLKMARIARVVRPRHIIIENVRGVRHDREDVFTKTRAELEQLDYEVDEVTIAGDILGVPQRRNRVFMVASRVFRPRLDEIAKRFAVTPRTVDWAIWDLMFKPPEGAMDEAGRPAPVTQDRIDYLFDHDKYDLPNHKRPDCHRNGDHTYNSVYGRLFPDEPAPTITTGFQVMGQGRYVHPHLRRTLTPREGARLQGFPQFFRLGERGRTTYGRLIGNAVPPKMVYVIALELLR